MNNKFKYFLFIFFIFFLYILPVKADDCGSLDIKIENYNSYITELGGLDCTNIHDEQTVIKCNDLNLKKNLTIVDLMKQKEQNKVCESNINTIDKIIEENEDNCGRVLGDNFTNIINTIMTVFYILGPILLIVFGSLDYAKASVSGDEKSLKKAHKTFFKRLLATVLLFLTPMITNIILSFNMSEFNLSGNAYSCNYDYLVYNKQWNITSVAKNTSNYRNNLSVNSQGVQAILDAAKKVHDKYVLEKWSYSLTKLTWGNIKNSLEISSHTTCCATYVGQVFYIANIFPEDEINKYGYNSAPATYNFLKNQGWIRIDNYDDLQPGDIVFENMQSSGKPGHVQIYYGDGKWYNAGSTSAIADTNRTSPYSSNDRKVFVCAYRMP